MQFFRSKIKLCDFGLSRKKTSLTTTAGTQLPIGTVAYMPPEVHVDNTKGQAYSDVWSTGVVMVELLNGQLPWQPNEDADDDDNAIMRYIFRQKKHRKMPDGLHDVDEQVRPLLETCLSYDTQSRPTALHAKEQLVKLIGKLV